MAHRSPVAKRVCLLTGASGTLGTEFCRLFKRDYDIAAAYGCNPVQLPSQHHKIIDPLNPRQLSGDLPSVFSIQADLLDDFNIARVVELTLARFEKIDLLVNAAVYSYWAPAVDSNELLDNAMLQFELNVVVPLKLSVLICRSFWRDRQPENRAANRNIINVSSSAGVYVYPNYGQSIYSASKAALNYLSCHMAHEFGQFGIRVNALAPNAFPRNVTTQRVAKSIRRLDQQSMTGQILIVDTGGDQLYAPT